MITVLQFHANRLRRLTSRKAEARDPELIALVRDVIDPPAVESTRKLSMYQQMVTPQASEIDAVLKKRVRTQCFLGSYERY